MTSLVSGVSRLVFVLALAGSLTLASLSNAATNDKVTICHFPPGNPANFQTITIGAVALTAHLAHGDFPGSCANDCKLFGSVCDDGNPCNTDTCNPDGTCAHTPKNCDDGNVCTTDSCDPVTGACVNTPKTGLTYCDDGNDCTSPDTCTSTGTCHGTPITGCCNTNADCGDGNLCTSDVCTNHTCNNPPATCTAPDLCTEATCNPLDGTCVNARKSCDDRNACTTDTCNLANGACVFTPNDIRGAITGIGSDALIVGPTRVPTTNNTVYGGDGNPVSLADFHVGDNVDVCALHQPDGSIVAASVTRLPPAG